MSSCNTLSIYIYLIDTRILDGHYQFQNCPLNLSTASFQWIPIIYLSVNGNVEQYQENQWNDAMDDQVGVDEIALKRSSSH